MDIREYEELLKEMTGIIKEAVHVVDAGGRSIIYNQAMANLEETRREEVLGTLFADTFSNIPKEESTMLNALRYGEATMNKQQTYLNKYGKEITTVNSTIPVNVDGKTVAAVEIARDITDIKNMSNKIITYKGTTADRIYKAPLLKVYTEITNPITDGVFNENANGKYEITAR